MTVYVDPLRDWGWRYGASCHMIADSVEELKEFAVSIGMKENWFQDKRVPHFDLTAKRRVDAVKNGAVELETRDYVYKIRDLGYGLGFKPS